MFHLVLKGSFCLWIVYTGLPKGCEALDEMRKRWHELPLLDEAVSGPGAEWPTPICNLIALIHQCKVLTVSCDYLLDIHVLEILNRREFFDVSIAIWYPQLALNIQAT